MSSLSQLKSTLIEHFSSLLLSHQFERQEITMTVQRDELVPLCLALRDEPAFRFEQLMDVTAVDYLDYGRSEWFTEEATNSGFDRGVVPLAEQMQQPGMKYRFAVVYHLLSVTHNHRCRIKVFLGDADLRIPSVNAVWNSANWFEREVFDLFGILFEEHPDLRRILTDYGFSGHPFRKDFPLIGEVEMRYDATLKRVVYEPVSIVSRTLVPKVIREDGRYNRADKVDKNHG